MTKTEFLTHLEEMMEMDAGSLQGTERLEDLGSWDSMTVVQFIAFADEEFGLSLSGSKLLACKTLDDLVALLDGRVAG